MAQLTAVVLAGGPHDEVSALQPGAINKAFVRVGGVTLVERTLVALRASHAIGRIVVVAPPQAHADAALALADEKRADGLKIRDSLRSGLEGLPPDELAIVCASDLPILSGEAVDDFVERAARLDPDVGYGCVERRIHEASYPHIPHTWAKLRDGTYCGGGMSAMKPRAYPHLARFVERLGHARKSPLHLAALFGWDVVLRFALRRLTIAQAEARAGRILGAPVRAIVSPHARTAVNVDRASDVALAEALVGHC